MAAAAVALFFLYQHGYVITAGTAVKLVAPSLSGRAYPRDRAGPAAPTTATTTTASTRRVLAYPRQLGPRAGGRGQCW